MKNIIPIIFNLILLSSISFAQQINIYTSGGTDTYNLADIDSITFTVSDDTSTTRTVTDIDGNVYRTIKIGDQTWMAENLKVTHYRNGDPIPNVPNSGDPEWSGLSTGAYCNNDYLNENVVTTYGRLYNWYAVNDNREIAPAGWHVPTDKEWKQLEMYLGMSQSEADNIGWRGTNEGSKMAGNDALWKDGSLEENAAFGESGLSALPGGNRHNEGFYEPTGDDAGFWSSTESYSGNAWSRNLDYDSSGVIHAYLNKRYGFSVRCVKD